jgi:hypothetical protein
VADSVGSYDNTSGFITANESGGAANTGLEGVATDTLDVVNNPAIAINFAPNPIYANDTSVLTFTLTNPNDDALTSATFSSLLPAGVSIADIDPISNTCSGSFSPALILDGDTISYSGGTIPANGTCIVSVLVKGTTIGDYTATTDLTASHPLESP